MDSRNPERIEITEIEINEYSSNETFNYSIENSSNNEHSIEDCDLFNSISTSNINKNLNDPKCGVYDPDMQYIPNDISLLKGIDVDSFAALDEPLDLVMVHDGMNVPINSMCYTDTSPTCDIKNKKKKKKKKKKVEKYCGVDCLSEKSSSPLPEYTTALVQSPERIIMKFSRKRNCVNATLNAEIACLTDVNNRTYDT